MLDIPLAGRDNHGGIEFQLFIEPEIFEPLQKYHGFAAARATRDHAAFVGGARNNRVLIGLNGGDNVGQPLIAALDFEHVRQKLVVHHAAALRRIVLKNRQKLAVANIELAPENHLVFVSAVLDDSVLEAVVYAVAERRIVRVNNYLASEKNHVRAYVNIVVLAQRHVVNRGEYARARHAARVVALDPAQLRQLHAREVRRGQARLQNLDIGAPRVVAELIRAIFLHVVIVVKIDGAVRKAVVFEQVDLLAHLREHEL